MDDLLQTPTGEAPTPAAASGLTSDLAPLLVPTPAAWIQVVLNDFDGFLIDHAGCERKAAASAMALIARYGDRPLIVETMTTLAREELEHFAQVFRLLQRRGLHLPPDAKDIYVNMLLQGVRPLPPLAGGRLLDRLIVSAFIEARSCERFKIVAAHLVDPELREFYLALQKSEAGHYRVFVRVAERLFGASEVATALTRFAVVEAAAVSAAPLRATVH